MTLLTMKHLICAIIALSVLYLTQNGVQCGRQEFDTQPLAHSETLLMDQLLAATNENRDAAYDELQEYHRQQPNYLIKWPGLRDLLLTAVDDDNTNININNNNLDSNNLNDRSNRYEIANSRLMERLRQLAETSSFGNDLENIRQNEVENETPIQISNQLNQLRFKNHGNKKNVQFRKQFMAPCHFKVCYMGPKRNVRYTSNL